MPKTSNTKKQRIEKLLKRISPDHILNETSIFYTPHGSPQLDQATVDHIKTQLRIYLNSWVVPEAQYLLK